MFKPDVSGQYDDGDGDGCDRDDQPSLRKTAEAYRH